MTSIFIFAVLIGLSYQHTTHALHTTHAWHSTLAPHVTHGPSLHNQFVFHYDYITHKMIILSNHNCYIFTLSNEERTQIHTDATMMFLEAKLMLMIATSAKTEVKMFSLDHHLLQICGNGILHYYTFA
ncbi:hypothetical protein ACJMK2_014822 [Sinanodonta woodiana]|uniref:Uncharacterized protein n=1 Tax=Sinanodonta woodiana TaxID=1069815 RepID=A0ABD3V2G9_SINWO